MKKVFSIVAALVLATTGLFANDFAKDLEVYTLDNGLTVYLWPDASASSAVGRVITKAGSVDEPTDYTGLAHYLEHLLFKGNNKIGALDWEKEEPLYNKIIDLYDELNKTPMDKVDDRNALIKQINEVSIEAAKYGATDDFSNLTESYGGTGLNAFTSYDLTCYFNEFPAGALEKWLELNSERLINPVIRSFQAELENVFEEYNMYQDDQGTHFRDFLFASIFQNTPYERSVIGTPEHLKNPSLRQVIKFFNTWYVPNNMALVIAGNFDKEQAKPLIAEKFGRLKAKELPARIDYVDTKFDKEKTFKTKLGYTPSIAWVYQGPKKGDKDELALQMALSILNNGRGTGLFDKLMLEGTIPSASASVDIRRYAGRVMVFASPYRDMQTGTYESNAATRRIVMKEIERLVNGDFPDWLFQSVKDEMLQSFKTAFENNSSKIDMATFTFIYDQPITTETEKNKAIAAMTKEEIIAAAKKYLSGNKFTIEIEPGEPKKNKLAKPAIKPLDPPKGTETEYSKAFKQLPSTPIEETYNDFNDVQKQQLYNGVNLSYTKNTKNDVFNLTLRYNVGSKKLPKLSYAAALLNSAGMMFGNTSVQDLRRKYSELGGSAAFSADNNYFYISISGDEANLAEICKLVTQQTLMPNLDNKQIKAMISGAYWGRMYEKMDPSTVSSALMEWVLFGGESKFIDRIDKDDLYKYSMVDGTVTESFLINKENLTETINEAKGYAVDMFYCGQRPIAEVAEILKSNTPIEETAKTAIEPYYRTTRAIEKPEVIFLADTKVQQAKVYFVMNSIPYEIADDVYYSAFNQYFSGGFSGLVMNEIREKRSMAYTAYASLSQMPKVGMRSGLVGFVGTQNDKAADAIDVFMELLQNMPDHADRIDNIKSYLYQTALAAKVGMRSKGFVFDSWEKMGYTEDPSKVNMPKIKNLKYEDIKNFYNKSVKGRDITIVIVGHPKEVNLKQIKAKYGKITKVSKNKLFKGGF